MSAEFLLTTLVIVVTPGTGVLYTLAAGLAHGGRASVVAALACTLGIVPHMAAAVTGLAAVLHTSSVAFQTLKYAGRWRVRVVYDGTRPYRRTRSCWVYFSTSSAKTRGACARGLRAARRD